MMLRDRTAVRRGPHLVTRWLFLFVAAFGFSACGSGAGPNPGRLNSWIDSHPAASARVWFEQPADEWTEALPVGNGRLGAMVFGRTGVERIQLNEESVWAGGPADRDRVGAHRHLPEVRRLLFEGRYAEAEEIVGREFLGERWIRSYQTLGDLTLSLPETPTVTGYRRELLLDSALVRVRYRVGNGACERTTFSSAPDQVLVIRIACDDALDRPIGIRLSREVDAEVGTEADGDLTLRGRATQGGAFPGVRFAARLRVLPGEGAVTTSGDSLLLEGSEDAVFLLAAATDYWGSDPDAEVVQVLDQASRKPYETLLASHVADYRGFYDRFDLFLGDDPARSGLPTDRRLAAVQEGGDDPSLAALYTQFARYLLISSSRPGNLPANLQGIWNEHIEAPWNSDYHTNINVQMNYWPAEVLNLSELHEPLFRLVDSLRVHGAKTARDVYGAGGFVVHHTTDAWWFTSGIGMPVYGMWVMGGAWLTRHLWDHYRYTLDRRFLEERAYPALQEAAAFFLDWLVENPATGRLVSGPSNSPENTFVTPDGGRAHLTMGPAMDQQIIWDLFTNLIEAAEALGDDDPFVTRVREARERLAGPEIGADGRLLEWPEPFEEAEPGHRHVSHLYGLHPGRQITVNGTPEWAAAARRSLEYRLEHGGGHTGWSRAWLVNFWARLLDAERAHENVQLLLSKSTLPNLFDTHPPFQIDGNFGGAAGVAEMLLQGHANEIHLLPAVPEAWADGWARGLRAPGDFEISLAWTQGRLVQALVRAGAGGPCRLRVEGNVQVSGPSGTVQVDRSTPGVVVFEAEADKAYVVELKP